MVLSSLSKRSLPLALRRAVHGPRRKTRGCVRLPAYSAGQNVVRPASYRSLAVAQGYILYPCFLGWIKTWFYPASRSARCRSRFGGPSMARGEKHEVALTSYPLGRAERGSSRFLPLAAGSRLNMPSMARVGWAEGYTSPPPNRPGNRAWLATAPPAGKWLTLERAVHGPRRKTRDCASPLPTRPGRTWLVPLFTARRRTSGYSGTLPWRRTGRKVRLRLSTVSARITLVRVCSGKIISSI